MRRISYGLALLGLAVVTLVPLSATRMHTWPMSLLATALCLFPLVSLLRGIEKRATWRTPPPLLFRGAIMLAIGTFLSAVFSPFAPASLARLWPTLGGIALYLWLHHAWSAGPVVNHWRQARIGRALGVAGALFTLVSLIQWSGGSWPLPWGDRNSAPFGHSTYTSGALILLLPWIALQARTGRGAARFVWCGVVAAALLALASTGSRGGVLALAFTGAFAALAAFALGRWSGRQKYWFTLGLFTIALTAVFTNPRLRDLVIRGQWSERASESNAQRHAMLDAGIRLGAERPLLGWGPGSIPLAYPHVRAKLDGGTENILQLHNTPAQVWATTGSVGISAVIFLVFGTLRAILHSPRTPIAFAASASLLGYGIVALTDHQLDLPAMTALLAASLAVLTTSVSAVRRERRPSRTLRTLIEIPLAVALFFAARATVRDLRAAHVYDQALTALSSGQTDEFIRALDRAGAIAPEDPYFQHRAAAWLIEQRFASRDPARQVEFTREAVTHLERSLTAGVHQEFAHFNLGWLLLDLDLDRPTDAAAHFTAAAHLVPDKGGVYFGLGLAHQAAGHRDAAIRAFALEAINDPRWLTSPAWEVPTLANARRAVRAEVLRLYEQLRPDHPLAATLEAWARWWWGEPVALEKLGVGFNAESARFLAALPTMTALDELDVTADPWTRVYAAWRNVRSPATRGKSDDFIAVAGGDRAFAAALTQRALRHRDDFQGFLAGPTADEPALVRTLRRERPGYGVFALHPEGPPLRDAYVVQENRLTSDLAAGLFPAKGWLPGRFLLALLPTDP